MPYPKKILIIGPAWIGDMIMSQSLFKQLQQKNPDCVIDVVAPAATYPLLQYMPEIRQGFCLSLKHKQFGFWQRLKLAKSLRGQHYDEAIVLPNSWKSALLPFLAGIQCRRGWHGESRYILLNDRQRLNKQGLRLQVQRFLALSDQFTGNTQQNWQLTLEELSKANLFPHMIVSAKRQSAVVDKFKLPTDKKIIALCPGAAYGNSKKWPAEYFATVASTKVKEGYQIYLLGALTDKDTAAIIQNQCHHNCINLVGKTSLSEAIDIISLTQAVVTNDSGLMHIACALALPVVALFGSSSPTFTPPLSPFAQILSINISCSPCFQRECPLGHHRCMRDLLPNSVIKTLDNVLSQQKIDKETISAPREQVMEN
ncbi:MAG: lipopolysaccharide heptosyltransferase II [Pseudomonadota bacterium]